MGGEVLMHECIIVRVYGLISLILPQYLPPASNIDIGLSHRSSLFFCGDFMLNFYFILRFLLNSAEKEFCI
jgi:hypothetical protein